MIVFEPIRCGRTMRLAISACVATVAAAFLTLSAAQASAGDLWPQAAATGDQSSTALDQSPTIIGPDAAPVTIVEYADFACEPCARLAFMIKAIVDTFPTKVRVVFKSNPPALNPEALLAHEAGLAAGAQGRFWDMADIMFANQDRLNRAGFIGMARQLNLDVKRFTQDLDSGRFLEEIDRDREEATAAGATNLPAFLVNGTRVKWPITLPDLESRVDRILAAKPR